MWKQDLKNTSVLLETGIYTVPGERQKSKPNSHPQVGRED